MTVAELIAVLKTCPAEALVCMPDGMKVTGATLDGDGYIGIPVVFLSDAEND